MNDLSGLTTLTLPRWEAHLPVFQVTVTADPSLPGTPVNTPNIWVQWASVLYLAHPPAEYHQWALINATWSRRAAQLDIASIPDPQNCEI